MKRKTGKEEKLELVFSLLRGLCKTMRRSFKITHPKA
jgi:hypothetical protein